MRAPLILAAALWLGAAPAFAQSPAAPPVSSTSPPAGVDAPSAGPTFDVVACAENPFKAGCPKIVISPGGTGTGLTAQRPGGLVINGLRPMDQPSFDRDTVRLPKANALIPAR